MKKLDFVGYDQIFESAKECYYYAEMDMEKHPEQCLIVPVEIIRAEKLRSKDFIWCDFREMSMEERQMFRERDFCWVGIYNIDEITDELDQILKAQYGLRRFTCYLVPANEENCDNGTTKERS